MSFDELILVPGKCEIKDGKYFIAVREDENGNEYYDTNTMAASIKEYQEYAQDMRHTLGDDWLEANPVVRIDEISVRLIKSHNS